MHKNQDACVLFNPPPPLDGRRTGGKEQPDSQVAHRSNRKAPHVKTWAPQTVLPIPSPGPRQRARGRERERGSHFFILWAGKLGLLYVYINLVDRQSTRRTTIRHSFKYVLMTDNV